MKNRSIINENQIEIWRIADIAQFLKLSCSEITRRIISVKDFPAPLILPGQKTTRGKRWIAHEVKDWVINSLKVV